MQIYKQGSLSFSLPAVCVLAQRKPIYKSPLSGKWGSYTYHFTSCAQKTKTEWENTLWQFEDNKDQYFLQTLCV